MDQSSNSLARTNTGRLAGYAPGLVLVAVITASAYGIRHLPMLDAFSPMILAILVGAVFANTVGLSTHTKAGIGIAGKHLLRLAIALLGLQLTFAQLADMGIKGVLFAALALSSTFVFTLGLGRLFGIDRKLSLLLAAGTSVCGASAIAGVNAVAGADDEDVSYAVACVTLFGTIAMFLYPALQAALTLGPLAFGYWIGLSVHEVGQVVAAGFQGGELAGQNAVITKLTRVMMLAPLVMGLFLYAARPGAARPAGAQITPWFIVAFLLLAILNSGGIIADGIRKPVVEATPFLLTAAMSALGLGTDVTKIRQRGSLPLLVAGLSSLFIAAVSLLLVKSML